MSKLDFAGQVALVTGAGRGLGASYVEALAAAGAKVMAADNGRSRDGTWRAGRLAARLREGGMTVLMDTGSVGVEADANAMIERTIEHFGKIDILINNAGTGNVGPIHTQSTEAARTIFDVHFFGTFWTMRAAIPHMIANKYGRIVNTGSALGAFAAPQMALYGSAKAAVISLTKSVAQEHLDIDLRANAITPIASTALANDFFSSQPMLDSAMFDTSHITPLVTFLSHASCKLTGKVFTAAAGRYARIWTSTAPGMFRPRIEDGDFAGEMQEMNSRDGEIEPYTVLDEVGLICP